MAEYTAVQTITPMQATKEFDFDYLIRLTGNQQSQSVYMTTWHSEDVAKSLYALFEEKKFQVETLAGVITWQANLLDYNGHYNAFLLEQISEQEFEKIAQKFSYEAQDIAPEQLAARIRAILELTPINYTPGDFAGMFKCNRESVLLAIDKLTEMHHQRIVEK